MDDTDNVFIAQYDYSARTENEMSFSKGDKLQVGHRRPEKLRAGSSSPKG